MIMSARQNRKADDSCILLQCRLDYLLGRLPQASIDNLHTFIAKRTSDHFCTSVVTVETRFGYDDANLLHNLLVTLSVLSPMEGP